MMTKRIFLGGLLCLLAMVVGAQPAVYEWPTESRNSSESMPCGGGDVGLNVWVEQGDVLFYVTRSGSFDENNTLLKMGRWRIHLPQPFRTATFRQQLVLADGYWQATDGKQSVLVWVDVEKPVVHIEVTGVGGYDVTYENWRTHDLTLTRRERFQTSYKFAAPKGLQTRRDSVAAYSDRLVFLHDNGEQTIFDATVHQQQLDAVKSQMDNPLRGLVFGGRMEGRLTFKEHVQGRYASTDYEGWTYRSRHRHVAIVLAARQGSIADWVQQLDATSRSVRVAVDRQQTRRWWHDFWQRSYVEADSGEAASMARNYTLFRYMLGCNSHGQWPTKFNGGLFTFDPEYVNEGEEYRLSPDFRNWGGGVHTAQNQRLVYWPMLKSGDYDLLLPQLDFYRYVCHNAELRSQHYWQHGGACLTEQIENYGLPCYPEYGTKRPAGFDPGMEYNAWLEYEWDTCLEFCQMALELHTYADCDISRYVPMIRSCLQFFDEHYQYLAAQRGAKRIDGDGRLVLYPGSGCETIKGAYNSTSTIAALRTVTQSLIDYQGGDSLLAAFYRRLPDITVRDGRIQPAVHYERVQNVESPQLYPVFPWRMYGTGRPGLDIARNTYYNDTLAVKFRSHVGWKQDNIFAACLGLTDEAARLARLKLADGPHRFPAFWGPGYDWTPDHNWGGSAMIGLQEMLLQEVGDTLYLFPAWPRDWDIRFRLHASHGTVVEAEMRGGQVVNLKVTPQSRAKDVVLR